MKQSPRETSRDAKTSAHFEFQETGNKKDGGVYSLQTLALLLPEPFK
jgi:hypothetical protein